MSAAELTRERLRELLSYDPLTGQFRWRVSASSRAPAGSVAGNVNFYGYVRIRIDGKEYKAHRLAFLYMTGEMPPAEVDHVSHVRADNRWSNLRPATRKENTRNASRYTSNTSGTTGVDQLSKNGAWRARITVNGRDHHLGCYKSFDDAAQARKEAERRFGYHPNHGLPQGVTA